MTHLDKLREAVYKWPSCQVIDETCEAILKDIDAIKKTSCVGCYCEGCDNVNRKEIKELLKSPQVYQDASGG